MIFFIFIVLLIIYLYKYYKDSYFYWRNQNVPGPFPIPILNNFLMYLRDPMHDANLKCLNKYGPVWAQFAFSTYQEINVCEPELIRELLIKDFRYFNGRNDASMFVKYFQKALFVRDETNGWRHIRQTISPLFTTGRLKAVYSNLDKPMRNLLENIDGQMAKRNTDHIDDFNSLVNFKRFTWDITLNLFFSVKFNSFRIEDDSFIEKFLSAKPTNTLTNILPFFIPLWIGRLFQITPMDKRTYSYIVNLVLNCIEQRRRDTSTQYNDLLNMMIQTGLDNDEIVGQCLALFLGGFESVASTCSFTLYELALQPHIQEKLYKELKQNYPEDDLEIDYDKITTSPYLEAVIKETLRLHTGIAKIFRKALVDCEFNGIKIPKETFVSIPTYALHHYEKYWPDPNKFKPERFLYKEPEPFTYLPFGDGPRQCVAMRLAQLEIRYFLINFLKRYESYRTEHTDVPVKYHKFNVLFNCDNVLLGIRKRRSSE